MDDGCILLDSEAPPDLSLVTEPSVYTVRSCGLLGGVLNEKLDL